METGRNMTVDLEEGALDRFVDWIVAQGFNGPPRIVADTRTWEAVGAYSAQALEMRGIAARRTIFTDPIVVAGAGNVLRLLTDLHEDEKLLIAAGSGTITDIVRFVAAKTGRPFLSLPSAPSVDAYASSVAALVMDGTKQTFPATAPLAIFADPSRLAGAPSLMIAAGFGDIIGKFTAVGDWRLGALLWEEPYSEALARRSLATARTVVEAVDLIGARSEKGVRILLEALVDSGRCMAEAGHSRPASGAEHHYSHFWEESFLAEGRPPLLHGLKVGIGAVMAAELWGKVKVLRQTDVAQLFEKIGPPRRDSEIEVIRALFGARSESIIKAQEAFLSIEGKTWEKLCAMVLSNWEYITRIAAEVPAAAEIKTLLSCAGCPATPEELGLCEEELANAKAGAHWMRNRFTIVKLARMLGFR